MLLYRRYITCTQKYPLLPGSLYLCNFFCRDKQQIDLLHIFKDMQFFLLYAFKYIEKRYLLHLLVKKIPQDSTSICGMCRKIHAWSTYKLVQFPRTLFSTKVSFTSFFVIDDCSFLYYYLLSTIPMHQIMRIAITIQPSAFRPADGDAGFSTPTEEEDDKG